MLAGGGHVDCPVAGGADVAGTASLHRLERAAFHLWRRFFRRLDAAAHAIVASDTHAVSAARPVEGVIEALVSEVPLLLRDPLLKSIVRLDLERTHTVDCPPGVAWCASRARRTASSSP